SWLGKTQEAAGSFAAAHRQKGPIQSKALEELRRIYETSARESHTSFETFLGKLSRDTPPVSSSSSHSARLQLSEYAGTDACRMCHADKHEAWLQTGMARMFRPYQPENIIGDFKQNNEFYAGDEVHWEHGRVKVAAGEKRFLFARMLTEEGRHFFEMKQSDGQWHRFPVDYTIGSKWQQAYATRLPNGRIHVFPIQYNSLEKRWINFWKVIDPPESERANLFAWEKLTAQTNYQLNCAVCHTSQLRNIKGLGFQPDNLEFREPGINCEMCHGPSSRHVSAMRQGKPYVKQPLDPPVAFDKISSQNYVVICSQCHMQSAVRKPGSQGELNYFRQDGLFFQHHKSHPFTEFSQKAFYKDGRFRETSFIVESLLRSACFRKGQVNCGHCHDPHRTGHEPNINSLKFLDQPDRMCLQCHSGYSNKIELHTRHPAASEGSRCRSCH
ncbi:MAG: hypothetical protein L0312_15400, partial [Acidobacteria bacterium]|nr:hypothetical protein [Acidobacteriota bacterium]